MPYPTVALAIGDLRIGAEDRDCRPIVNPATEQVLAMLPVATEADIAAAADAAARAFGPWRAAPPWQRGAILHEAARQMRLRSDRIAAIVVLENGKPLAEAKAEVMAAADTFEWYAEEGRRLYGRTYGGRAPGATFMTMREPVGPVALFSPWNFPVVTLVRKLAAALAAGCSIVAKPAEETPASALMVAECLHAAGLPTGVLNLIFGEPALISSQLIRTPAIAKISFTGSTAVGRQLAAQAGTALKRMTMELGGHAPVIVCGDVDPVRAAELCAAAKFRNAGQVCNAASRFIVDRRIQRAFAARFAAIGAALPVGDGRDPDIAMGPLSNHRRIEAMARLTLDAVQRGARLLAGGVRLDRPGFFFAPTVLSDVPADAEVMCEEPFGPIAPIIGFDTIDEALAIANSTPYGLAGFVLTQDLGLARRLTRDLRVGMVGLNAFQVAFPETPFGGVKDSGWGSEGGSEGIEPYLVTKFVHEG